MIELKSVSRKDDAITNQSTDTQVTAQRMLTLLLDVLRPFESDLPGPGADKARQSFSKSGSVQKII